MRREIRLYEGGVFNTEALKYSIKRLNQLAYFKALEGDKDVNVEKTPDVDNKVDVTLKFEEQNRNQITFGAGVSQWEGYFGQLSFQTSNFMGRGETFSILMQAGSRAQNYQIAFTEPFLFDRNITGGIDIFKRRYRLLRLVLAVVHGRQPDLRLPVEGLQPAVRQLQLRAVRVTDINEAYLDPLLLAQNPYLRDSLLIGEDTGVRTMSKIVPSFVHNSVDSPIFPTFGKRLTASVDLAVFGGNTKFIKPTLEGGLVHPADTAALDRHAGPGRVHHADRVDQGAADLREAVPRRGVQRPRLRHLRPIGPKAPPVTTIPATYNGYGFFPGFVGGEARYDPTTTEHRAGRRREQEPAVQRRVSDLDCRTGPARALLRRRPGAGQGAAVLR